MAKYLTDIKHCHRIQAIKQFLTTQLRKKRRGRGKLATGFATNQAKKKVKKLSNTWH